MRLTIALFIVICGLTAAEYPPIKKFVIQGQAQGTTYQVTYYAGDSTVTKSQIDSLVDKIDSSLSL